MGRDAEGEEGRDVWRVPEVRRCWRRRGLREEHAQLSRATSDEAEPGDPQTPRSGLDPWQEAVRGFQKF